jgi:1-deoxy-D-xylulose-5-phosphate synthase
MLYTAFQLDGPAAVRYPRGSGPGIAPEAAMKALPIGKAQLRREGKRVALLAFGTLLAPALQAGDELDATVVNMRFVKPLDVALVRDLAATHELLVTIEENAVIGGAGAEVARSLQEQGFAGRVLQLGLPDRFIDHGEQGRLLAQIGLDKDGIVARVQATIRD